jgi:Type I phosphodiesterase / nucleotide pyrophosphatase
MRTTIGLGLTCAALTVLAPSSATAHDESHHAPPKVVVVSLDGAKPDLIEFYLATGLLDRNRGLGRLARRGVVAGRNVTVTPSVTAVAHIAIATGSTSVHNDIGANTFHPVSAPITSSLSGFAAPIGGYQLAPLGPADPPTAEPLWVRVRAAGRQVVTATWPGSDGADIQIGGTLVQSAIPFRTNDYTVPFGAFGGLGAVGLTLDRSQFTPADQVLQDQLVAAGLSSFSPVQVTSAAPEALFCNPNVVAVGQCGNTGAAGRSIAYDVRAAALDGTNDGTTNYEQLVVFDARVGVQAGPFSPPSTGPAVTRVGGPSAPFYLEGSGNRVGTSYFVASMAPDLSTVHLVRYSANFIPRNTVALGDVDDVNGSVGFWRAQPDFRIPERLSPGFGGFTDVELEATYEDQVATFMAYQTAVATHALRENSDASLTMLYFEQPDGSGHQFTLTDRRQASNPLDPTSVGWPGFPLGASGQDRDKVARYRRYLLAAYRAASDAVESVVQEVGVDDRGEPKANVVVVSDHGMAPFHSAVSASNLLRQGGVDASKIGIRTTGPALHVYVNLAGREPGGTVDPAAYAGLVDQIAGVLRGARDPNRFFNPGSARLFNRVWTRPMDCGRPGFCTDQNIGQDFGDVLALMVEGYNFDGIQSPVVARLDDGDPNVTAVYSVPNFYGAHGHDSNLDSMSAIFMAAGPDIKQRTRLRDVRNIDVAPTVLEILGIAAGPTVDGEVIDRALARDFRPSR